jgi:RES domain-containing protein
LRPLAAPWQGTVFRSVRPKYWASEDFLTGEASKRHGGRWNAPSSFRVVYLSLSLDTALEEVKGWSRAYGVPPEAALPRVLAAIEADLKETLDLTDGAIRRRLRVSFERMTGEDWRAANERGREALTQAIGRAAFEAELEALLVPSAQDPDGGNLLVFPDKLLSRSTLHELGAFE